MATADLNMESQMKWKYHLITLTVSIASLYAYVAAPVIGSVLLGVGIVLEGIFWSRLFKRPKYA
jgi:hypothetical protein